MEVLTKDQLAQLLRRSPATISSDMVRRRASLPRFFKLPGSSRPLWLRATVEAFLHDLADKAGALPDPKKSKGN